MPPRAGDAALGAVRSGQVAARARSPDHDYYQRSSGHDGKLAAIAVARKLARRCYHTLRAIDPEVLRHPDRLTPSGGTGGPDRPSNTRVSAVSSYKRRARQHSCWTAL